MSVWLQLCHSSLPSMTLHVKCAKMLNCCFGTILWLLFSLGPAQGRKEAYFLLVKRVSESENQLPSYTVTSAKPIEEPECSSLSMCPELFCTTSHAHQLPHIQSQHIIPILTWIKLADEKVVLRTTGVSSHAFTSSLYCNWTHHTPGKLLENIHCNPRKKSKHIWWTTG